MSTKSQNTIPATPKKTRIMRTSENFEDTPLPYVDFEQVYGPSETVPEMVVDLRTMINRQENGMPVPMFGSGYAEEEYPDLYKMDEVELMQYRLNLAENMEEMSNELHVATKQLEEKQRLENERIDKERQEFVIKQQKEAEKLASKA